MGAAPSAAPLRCRRRALWPEGRWRRRSKPRCRTAAPSAPSRPLSSLPPQRRAAARRRRRPPWLASGTAGRAREAGSVQRRRAGARGRRGAAGRTAQAANGAGSATRAGLQPKRLSACRFVPAADAAMRAGQGLIPPAPPLQPRCGLLRRWPQLVAAVADAVAPRGLRCGAALRHTPRIAPSPQPPHTPT